MARSTSKLHQDAGYMSELRFRSLNSLDGGEASIYVLVISQRIRGPAPEERCFPMSLAYCSVVNPACARPSSAITPPKSANPRPGTEGTRRRVRSERTNFCAHQTESWWVSSVCVPRTQNFRQAREKLVSSPGTGGAGRISRVAANRQPRPSGYCIRSR